MPVTLSAVGARTAVAPRRCAFAQRRACVPSGATSRAPRVRPRASAEPSAASAPAPATACYKHVLLAVVDSNPYLSPGTRAACAAAAAHALAAGPGARMSVLIADPTPLPSGVDPAVRADTLRWHLTQAGWTGEHELLQRGGENAATAISDAAEDADCVVLAAAAVHAKAVDVNLLAEFMPCPLLMVPF